MSHTPAPPSPADGTRQAWQRLWASGVVDTFGSGTGPAHTLPPLVPHWRDWLGTQPADARVLDLCTGNGVLLRHWIEVHPQGRGMAIGVDLAPTHPTWLDSLAPNQADRLRIQGGVSVANLPLADASVDLVVSQFGVEYAPMEDATHEAWRVLCPGGRWGWVLHHADGRPAQLAAEELRHLDWLGAQGWLETLKPMAEALHLAQSHEGRRQLDTEAHWLEVRRRFDAQTQALRAREKSSPCPDVLLDLQAWSSQVLRVAAHQGPQAALRGVEEIAQLLADLRLRLQDLLSHTLDAVAFAHWQQRIKGLGLLVLEARPLVDRGHLMGWWLVATKPPSA